MSKKRYLEAETLKEFLRMGMKVGHIHTLRDVENYIDTQPEATPQEVAGQCWRNSKYDPPTEADADRLGRIIVWGAAVKHFFTCHSAFSSGATGNGIQNGTSTG